MSTILGSVVTQPGGDSAWRVAFLARLLVAGLGAVLLHGERDADRFCPGASGLSGNLVAFVSGLVLAMIGGMLLYRFRPGRQSVPGEARRCKRSHTLLSKPDHVILVGLRAVP
ncbi:MAG TPA: hypothetical protein VMH26_20750 [Burkholderiales bacterium]|nr:hypothetical protein [Burkholderiales bacterium]